MSDLLFVLMIFLFVVLAVAVMCIPIWIACSRGVRGTDMTLIVLLSVLGVFFGFTWICALVMSLCCGTECNTDNLDKLATVARLYRDKAISKTEYEKLKKKLLNDK